ncbi:A/G-specific adenine glycosylase [Iodobacter sp. CM08]|uniref:A/G-specific adenine glycosylase n=1 Tax=Iodobacter sp. CM08 TaxID=3085902 RepID=UPI0029827A9C|nr:A/G-specific adenine glycosylase [Iodobacter sp. CM08]MDW5417529.1 A/G-specific adenine glycosylase [Iodobacter sp. CM08]
MSDFSQRLIAWQAVHGRHNLPWQVSDPYKVWLSEIMLQQTQVITVIPYYQQFLERFPDVASLASASGDDVLARWSGLGYYSRARNLHKAAKMVMERFGGAFPRTPELLAELPGVGPSTAAAIAAFSFGAHAAILDGNVKRVLARWAGISGYPGTKIVERELWQLAATLLPEQGIERYTQSLMDMGATICTPKKPACITCPVFDDCIARQQGRQAELPTPKPKKVSPERQTVLMMITRDGKLLLERRPPTGIWGGLWSLPETTSTLEASKACSQRFGLDVEFDSAAEDFVHVFTHFRLTITPLPGSVIGQTALTHEDHLGWFSQAEALELGLPSPVRKLVMKGR